MAVRLPIYPMKRLICLLLSWMAIGHTLAQKTLSEADVIDLVLANSPAIRAVDLSIRQSDQLLKGAYSIPNLDVFTDSPSGEFYTIGVNQSFQLPTVYKRQYNLQKGQTGLAQAEKRITQNDIRFRVRNLYLALQYAEALRQQYQLQDSVYNQLRVTAGRQFVAGQIDYLAKAFAESQAGEVRNQLAQATADVQTIVRQLGRLAGRNELIRVDSLVRSQAVFALGNVDSVAVGQNPALAFLRQTELISEQQIGLERARSLPGIMVGYYNQSSRETPTQLRFRFGLTLPVWFGQYRSRTVAAQTGLQLARQRTSAQVQTLSVDLQQAQGDFEKFRASLDYYETTGLRQSDDLINTARRLFGAGQNDYVSFLRTINDAYAIRLRYLDALRSHNQSLLTINYLTGNL
ncbi:TolC family protein [Fibrella aestuarina]|jgi:cobalt-zinc-cadmium efflux system outer membrane protein|uniref:TolC family protein n=2 Tax=Fibrivirga algicola TaxID=2950420 RepID=A0ABX0QTP6_9BACT|nr:TolC family protein [Fibrivirga algicola]